MVISAAVVFSMLARDKKGGTRTSLACTILTGVGSTLREANRDLSFDTVRGERRKRRACSVGLVRVQGEDRLAINGARQKPGIWNLTEPRKNIGPLLPYLYLMEM